MQPLPRDRGKHIQAVAFLPSCRHLRWDGLRFPVLAPFLSRWRCGCTGVAIACFLHCSCSVRFVRGRICSFPAGRLLHESPAPLLLETQGHSSRAVPPDSRATWRMRLIPCITVRGPAFLTQAGSPLGKLTRASSILPMPRNPPPVSSEFPYYSPSQYL